MGKMSRIVAYTATRNIYENLAVCVRSLLKNGNVDTVCLFIEDDNSKLLAFDPTKVIKVNAKEQRIFTERGVNYNSRWTYMTMLKAAMHRILPQESKVLVLDCDTIVERDLSPLWDIDLTSYYFAMVKQKSDGRNGDFMGDADYFNAGVMMCNLDKLRDGKGDEIINALNTHYYEYPEQDCINKLCKGGIKELSGRYNFCEFTIDDDECVIRHFAANKNWRKTVWAREYEDEL